MKSSLNNFVFSKISMGNQQSESGEVISKEQLLKEMEMV